MNDHATSFLFGVEQSVSGASWIAPKKAKENLKDLFKQEFDLTEAMSELLVNRNFNIEEFNQIDQVNRELINKKELLEQEKIGKVISVQAENGSYFPDLHPHEDYRISYAGKKVLGGGIILTQIHDVDYLYWFFNYPKSIFSV